ncbi:MAG: DNA polymerase I, partial [Deltaproteobacteria bacterium]|nr:DNA polymerase I [Deltaproteobacteria bacterium]
MAKKKLIIIDGMSCVYRAYHAIPPFSNSKGLPTNATYGYTQTLRKIIASYSPDYIAVAFDLKGPTIRHELFEGYKAERKPMEDALVAQIDYIKEVTTALNIPLLELSGYEADDILATIVKKLKGEDIEIFIVTGDKDLCQLVDENVFILEHAKDKVLGRGEVKEKLGVPPELVRDLLSLAGDTADNIPGIAGVGPKTAAKLLNEYGSFDEVFLNADNVSGKKLKERLKEHKDNALLSRELATLHDNVPLTFTLKSFKLKEADLETLEPLFLELEFTKLLKDIMPADDGGEALAVVDHKVIENIDDAKEAVKGFGNVKELCLTLSGFEEKDKEEKSIGVKAIGKDAFVFRFNEALSEKDVVESLKELVENEKVKKITENSKALFNFFGTYGVDVAGVAMDIALASYLLNPSASHKVEDLYYLKIEQRLNIGSTAVSSAMKLQAIEELTPLLKKELKDAGLIKLFEEMELPLSKVLSGMELLGIEVDTGRLEKLQLEMEGKLKDLTEELYRMAGYEFNIASPKQLSELLFTKLGLKPVKKTKTGFSTDESVLTKLATQHEIPEKIIAYRQIAKLKSTYIDALLVLADKDTRRVHTTFNQSSTATGRLSSSNPNMQNIPIKGEYGPKIRGAFIAKKGYKLMAADYSQV